MGCRLTHSWHPRKGVEAQEVLDETELTATGIQVKLSGRNVKTHAHA